MKVAIGAAIIGALLPALVCGQAGAPPPESAGTVEPTGFEYDSYLYGPPPRSTPRAPQAAPVARQALAAAVQTTPAPTAPAPPPLQWEPQRTAARVAETPRSAATSPEPARASIDETPAETSMPAHDLVLPAADEAAEEGVADDESDESPTSAPAKPVAPTQRPPAAGKPIPAPAKPAPLLAPVKTPPATAAPSTPPAAAPLPPPAPVSAPPAPAVAVPLADDSVQAESYAAPSPPQPWQLPQPQALQNLGIKVGGWVQQGITFNSVHPVDNFNGPLATNDRAGEWQLNQAWLYLIRPTKTDGCGWDLGGRIDMSYGTDWRFGKNPGLEDRINSEENFYGLVLPQFYLEAAVNDLTVRMGHFATSFGYEDVPSVANFFYSHSYAMSYTEPLLVTGVQADYRLNDQWLAVFGVHRGWYMFEDFNDDWDVLAGLRWTSDDQRTKLSLMTNTGPQDPAGANNRVAYSFVLSQLFGRRWRYVFQHNGGFEDGGSFVAQGEDAHWLGINQALFYTLNPRWTFGARSEWLRDEEGSRVIGVGNWIESGRGWRGGPGFAGDFYQVSVGANYRPHPSVVFRPEVRWDWYEGADDVKGDRPFGGVNDNQVTMAMDLIVTF